MNEILRTIARELGLDIRFTVHLSLALAVLVVAGLTNLGVLYGLACALSLVAGTVWDREIRCNACGTSLEEREPGRPVTGRC